VATVSLPAVASTTTVDASTEAVAWVVAPAVAWVVAAAAWGVAVVLGVDQMPALAVAAVGPLPPRCAVLEQARTMAP